MGYSDHSVVVGDKFDFTNNELKIAHFLLIDFAEVVDCDDVVSFDDFSGLVELFRYNLTIFDSVRSTKRGFNEGLSIR